VHVKHRQRLIESYDMVYRYVQNNSHGLIIHVNFMVKCMCYMSLGCSGCFVTGAALTGSHYRTYIISREVGLSWALVLWIVAYNG
jgi:hypothetical protein